VAENLTEQASPAHFGASLASCESNTSRRLSGGRLGCGLTACWGSGACRLTAPRAESSLPCGWRRAEKWSRAATPQCSLDEELNRRGWDQGQLDRRRKSDPENLRIAERLRAESTATRKWIAQHLGMGAPGHVANCLRNRKQRNMRICAADPFFGVSFVRSVFFVNLGWLFACVAGSFLVGCRAPMEGTGARGKDENRVVISESEAKSIVEEKLRPMKGLSFEIERPTLVNSCYWRVTSRARDRYFTNYVWGTMSSRDAAALVAGISESNLKGASFEVKAVDFVEGYYWCVLVRWLPSKPSGDRIVYVSGNDGTVIDPFTIEPSP